MREVSPSARPGMGSTLYASRATFRVWAPNAASVAVTGSFNHWSKQANPQVNEGNGYWSTDFASAQAGDRYKYVIVYQSTELNPWRPDPSSPPSRNSKSTCCACLSIRKIRP
jgi:1,4-alpha-glucan branching enzyme